MTAKAHAALGDQDEFERALKVARTSLDQSLVDAIQLGIFFLPEKLDFQEARVWGDLGDIPDATQAALRALPPTT